MLRPGGGGLHDTDSGFSLVEVLVAIAILVTGAMSLARLFDLAAAANLAARETTYAAVLAAQTLEQLRAARRAPAAGTRVEYVDGLGNTVAAEAAPYIRRWTIEPVAGDPSGTLVAIRVVVSSRAGAGEVRLATVRAVESP